MWQTLNGNHSLLEGNVYQQGTRSAALSSTELDVGNEQKLLKHKKGGKQQSVGHLGA